MAHPARCASPFHGSPRSLRLTFPWLTPLAALAAPLILRGAHEAMQANHVTPPPLRMRGG